MKDQLLHFISKNQLVEVHWQENEQFRMCFCRILQVENDSILLYNVDSKKAERISLKAITLMEPRGMNTLNQEIPKQNYSDLMQVIQHLSFEEKDVHWAYQSGAATEEDGTIRVENGKIIIQDAKGEGKQPLILPSPELDIRINHAEVKEPTVVHSNDLIEWDFHEKKPQFEIQISADQLKVWLKLNYLVNHSCTLKDQKGSLSLKAELNCVVSDLDVSALSSQIMDEVNRLGIKVHVNTFSITRELMSPSYQPVLIAEGLAPVEPIDGYLEVIAPQEIVENVVEPHQRINFKERFRIPSVQKGEVIAIVHKPQEGKIGYNVFGKSLLPKTPKQVEVKLRQNVEMGADGKITALRGGRPSILGSVIKYVEVSREYQVKSDVDIKTGNIYFNGDVIIQGDVKENMRVEASGNIYIYGNVYSSHIISSQNINIKGNVLNSFLFGGQHGLIQSEVYHLIQKLYLGFEKLDNAFQQTMSIMMQKGMKIHEGQLLASLVEVKFPQIMEEARKYQQFIDRVEQYRISVLVEYIMLKRMIHPFTNPPLIVNLCKKESLRSLLFVLNQEISRLENMIEQESTVELRFAQQANIRTNGEVRFTGEGMINSEVFAGTNCIVNGQKGVIRGGKVQAVQSILANEVGTVLGAPPMLIAGKAIQVRELNNSKISVQNYSFDLDQPVTNLKIEFEPKTRKIVKTVNGVVDKIISI
jgi:uncharacterized protein